jgi:predicted amidophosphoribosyltransferase
MPSSPQKSDAVKCAKCGHWNENIQDACARCHASLYVDCGACGQTNPRHLSRCSACGERLHRKFWRLRYLMEKVPFLRGGVNLYLVGAFILLVLIVFVIVAKVAYTE